MVAKRIETELGTEKQCSGCQEFYPLDRQFWYRHGRDKHGNVRYEERCKACWEERYRKVAA